MKPGNLGILGYVYYGHPGNQQKPKKLLKTTHHLGVSRF